MARMIFSRLLKTKALREQILRFIIVGSANTAFSYGVYSLFIYVGLKFYLASLIALVLGVLLSFVTQGRLVFGAKLKGRFGIFVAVWGILYVLNTSLIALLSAFGINYYWAGFLSLFPVTLLSFILQRSFVFTK